MCSDKKNYYADVARHHLYSVLLGSGLQNNRDMRVWEPM